MSTDQRILGEVTSASARASETSDGLPLSAEHRRMLLEESGITPEVVAERGYRTLTQPQQLAGLGFSSVQRRPGLLLPLHGTDGTVPLYILRPDQPRTQGAEGKKRTLKYEMPAGHGVRLDCPPRCWERLGDPGTPLWITEGQKKADALASHGLCAIALLGVWNWKGKNGFGGTTFLADWDYVHLKDREVRIVFDSDVMTKPAVRMALDRLTEHLRRKGAHVTAVYLPADSAGKIGVDDYLAAGHSVADLEALVQGPRPTPKAAAPTVELLDEAPPTMRRPLALLDGHAYAACWLPRRVKVHEREDKDGRITVLNPPEVRGETGLYLLRNDGRFFGQSADSPLEEIGFTLSLPDLPRDAATMSTRAVKAYGSGQRPNAPGVVGRLASVYDRYIDFGRSLGTQAEMTHLAACLSLSTYFLPAWTVVGYPWFTGERGSGKTQAGTVWAYTSYLGVVVLSSGSFAALRDLAEAGAALMFDDAETLADVRGCDPAKRELALSGYRLGSLVPIKEPTGDKGWRIRWVNAFAPRAFTAIALPDGVLASRCIVIPLVRTADPRRGNSDPANVKRWPCDRRALIDDCWSLALAHLPEAEQVWAEMDDEVDTLGRDFEPWRAVLATARLTDRHGTAGLEDTVREVMLRYREERVDILGDDLTVAVVRTLVSYVEDEMVRDGVLLRYADGRLGYSQDTMDTKDTMDTSSRGWSLSASEVCALIRLAEAGREDDVSDWPTPSRVGRVLSHLRIRQNRENNSKRSRGRHFTLTDIRRLALGYGIESVLTAMTSAGNPPDPLHLVSIVSLVSEGDNGNLHRNAERLSAGTGGCDEP